MLQQSGRDRIIQGITNLGELQGNKRKINDLSEQTGYIRNIQREIPTLFDKYEYLKNMSREKSKKADEISTKIYQLKRYIEPSRDISKTIKENILANLESIEEDVGTISMPEEEPNGKYISPFQITDENMFAGKKIKKRSRKFKSIKSRKSRRKRSRKYRYN